MERRKLEILFLGATGYVGGVVLERMLGHPAASQFNFTALIRNKAKGPILEQIGVKPVIASFSDSALLRDLSSRATFIFCVADSDDLEAAKDILAGMKARYEKTGEKSVLIHTSGCGVVADDANGDFASAMVYSDMNLQQLDSISDDQPHRPVDLLILDADREGYIDAYIVLPSLIFGIADGRLANLGLHRRHSLGFRLLSEYFVERGQAGMVGQGKNICSLVHVDDLTDLYLLIFDTIRRGRSSIPHGREGCFFVENGETSFYAIYKAYARAMATRGIGTDEPTSLGLEDSPPAALAFMYGKNMRIRADRARSMGWNPNKTLSDLLDTIPSELDAQLATSISKADPSLG